MSNTTTVGAGLKPAPTTPLRKKLRLPGYDYSQAGFYFVTICAHNRRCLFGEITDGTLQLNPAGLLVAQAWLDLPKHYPHLVLNQSVIMPNHFHGIVVLERPGEKWQSTVEDGAAPVGVGLKPAPTTRHGLPEIIRAFKTFSSRRINEIRETPGTPVWQRSYYEHIIRNDADYDRIAEYVLSNPAKWLEDSLHPDSPTAAAGAGLKPAPTSPRRKNLRLRGYDYTQTGLYFVTVCAQERICLFGEINDGVMHLNSHGVLVEQAWLDLPAHYPNVELDQFVVMPNHFHGIFILTNGTDMNPDVGAGFKPAPKKCHGLPEIVRAFKSFSARRINELRQTPGVSVWQRNYYEHVIRDDADYQRIAEYVVNNPARWAEDSLHPEYEADRANIANVGAGLNTVGADVKEDVKAGVGAGLRPAPTADRREQSDE